MTHDPEIKGLNPATGTDRGKKQKSNKIWLCSSSTVVGHSTHDHKVQGSNPIMGNLKENIKRSTKICMCPCGTMVEHSTHDPKIKVLNSATDTGIGKKHKDMVVLY